MIMDVTSHGKKINSMYLGASKRWEGYIDSLTLFDWTVIDITLFDPSSWKRAANIIDTL